VKQRGPIQTQLHRCLLQGHKAWIVISGNCSHAASQCAVSQILQCELHVVPTVRLSSPEELISQKARASSLSCRESQTVLRVQIATQVSRLALHFKLHGRPDTGRRHNAVALAKQPFVRICPARSGAWPSLTWLGGRSHTLALGACPQVGFRQDNRRMLPKLCARETSPECLRYGVLFSANSSDSCCC
jgi:hypothetical protein